MNVKRSGYHRGFTMVEILLTLALLGTFGLVATHLFTSTFKLYGQNSRSIEAPIRFDAAINTLRADMESSTSVDLPAADSLIVHDGAGGEVRWKADGKQLSRAASGEIRSWEIGQRLQFQAEGALFLIHSADSNSAASDIALVPGGQRAPVLK